MQKFIAYYRVSTQKQGNSGLGLYAQRTDVGRFISKGGELIMEFEDIVNSRHYFIYLIYELQFRFSQASI